ncbi:MAG: DoxX family protein [Bacteroidales bacterium]|nr:DoxX family protein [Bacteroidales bacterium]
MKKLVIVFPYIIGILFLISGLSKIVNVFGFQNLIGQYGFPSLHFLAPFIVLAEILLGCTLLLQIKTRLSAFLSLLLLLSFTVAYTYGNISHGITDCGCFGNFIKTESPFIVYLRNILLIGASLYLVLNTSSENYIDVPSWKKSILLTVLLPSIFIAGMTSRIIPNKRYEHPFENKPLKTTLLNNYVIHPKAKELVFFMSYSCNHCINSIENYKAYTENNVVDTTLCYVLVNSENPNIDSLRNAFRSHYPNLQYTETSQGIDFISAFPTAFYIENDTIKEVIIGELPSPFVLLH